jgi:hypothetical protein
MSASRRAESHSQGPSRRGFSRGAVTAALVVGLLIGAGATYTLAGPSLSRTTTTTTTLPAVTGTSTTTVTATQTSQAAATVGPVGLRLSTSINATDLTVGQDLNISISLFNTLTKPNTLQQGGRPGTSPPGNWTFYGVPVVTWPECSSLPGFEFPTEVLVLSGNYTAQQLSSLANASLPALPCTAGEGIVPIYAFEPSSDLVEISYFAPGGGSGSLGIFRSASHFTLGGYWNLTTLAEEANGSSIPYISEPALCQLCKAPSSIPFAPGVYTVGVSEEWGQFVVLHFQVTG